MEENRINRQRVTDKSVARGRGRPVRLAGLHLNLLETAKVFCSGQQKRVRNMT